MMLLLIISKTVRYVNNLRAKDRIMRNFYTLLTREEAKTKLEIVLSDCKKYCSLYPC